MAIAATCVWEVRTTGAATNSGGFDASIASPGTDWSQFATPQYSLTNGVATTTSATLGTVSATADMVGNVAYVAGGTGAITAGWYEIISAIVGVSITLDRSTGIVTGTGVTINIGGALSTIALATAVAVAGNIVWVKATATYSVSVATSFALSGSAGLPICFSGYSATRGDNLQATVQLTANSINMFSGAGAFLRVRNFILDCNSKTSARGCNFSGGTLVLENILAKNFTISGFGTTSSMILFRNCVASGGVSVATAGFALTTGGASLENCRSTGNACSGVTDTQSSASATNVFDSCIFDNNTGASSDGLQKTGSQGCIIKNCVFYTNGRDGLRCGAANTLNGLSVRNCIFVSNSGNGINSTTDVWSASPLYVDLNFNAFYNNGTARTNVPVGGNDVALTGDPFTNGAANDFSLNATAGAGAGCRAAAFAGVMQSGGTGFLDIGALQHPDSGGGSTIFVQCHNVAVMDRSGVVGY